MSLHSTRSLARGRENGRGDYSNEEGGGGGDRGRKIAKNIMIAGV